MTQHYIKKSFFIILALIWLTGKAQVNQVLQASQFGGITNVSYNPAIADNPFKFDMNLLSYGASLENNYIGLDTKTLTNHNLFNDPNFQADHLTERLNGSPKRLYTSISAQGPLSFMVTWGKHKSNKNAFAFSWHSNTIFNADGVSEQLARSLYHGFGASADSITGFNYKNLSNQNLSIKALSWVDIGATYSRVLYDKGAHMIKAGVTGKVIIGIAGVYLTSKNINYKVRNYDTLDINNTDVSYGHSGLVSTTTSPTFSDIWNGKSKASFAADLGFVYEWQPNKEKYKYTADCQEWYRQDVNKYKLAVGFSVIDIGRVKFERPGNVSSYYANIQGWDLKTSGISSVSTFDSVLASKPANFKSTQTGAFKIWLPTRFNIFVDYEIYKGLGANLTSTISPVFASDANQVHYPTSVMLTPRYDWKFFGAYIPLSYNEYGNFGAGFGLRLGPLFVTSSNIITTFAAKNTYAMNLQAGLKLTIPNLKKKDHHKDRRLGNSVTDSICPSYTADLYKYFPNSKGDLQYSSPTPNNVGPGTYSINRPNKKGGCPDTASVTILYRAGVSAGGNKNDGVCSGATYDLTKLYPNTGYASYTWNTANPSAVGPGIYTLVVAGPSGCTDTAVAAIAAYNKPVLGGNKTDSIYPGKTYDLTVLYPNIGYKTYTWSGAAQNGPVPTGTYQLIVTNANGCADTATATITQRIPPVLSKKEIQTIKYAYDNLEFETGKDKIKQKSYLSLEGLAKLLIDKGYGLKIDGHTDNVGKADFNMKLSLQRAEAVKAFLIDKGVSGAKIETEGFGMTKPIADNKTAEGRQKNRRVEMKVLF